MSREQILRAALALTPDERAMLASEIFESLEPADEGVAEAWEVEIQRRSKNSSTALHRPSGEEVFRSFGRSLRSRRPDY